MTKRVAIVTPIYKSELTKAEALSIASVREHLSDFDCYLIYPQGLTLSWDTTGFILLPSSPRRFSSVRTYNDFCMDSKFYKYFLDYATILYNDIYAKYI